MERERSNRLEEKEVEVEEGREGGRLEGGVKGKRNINNTEGRKIKVGESACRGPPPCTLNFTSERNFSPTSLSPYIVTG